MHACVHARICMHSCMTHLMCPAYLCMSVIISGRLHVCMCRCMDRWMYGRCVLYLGRSVHVRVLCVRRPYVYDMCNRPYVYDMCKHAHTCSCVVCGCRRIQLYGWMDAQSGITNGIERQRQQHDSKRVWIGRQRLSTTPWLDP